MKEQQKKYKYIIIGAGISGLTAIKGIREIDASGSILLLSGEKRLPYKRTKINKHIAVGFNANDFALKTADWYEEQGVEIIYNEALLITPELNQIKSKQSIFFYDKLLLSMGAQSNIPNIGGIENIPYHFVHYAHEVEQLIKKAQNKKHYLIIGGGIEGLETADQLLSMNKKVTIVQRSSNPLKSLFPNSITNKIYQAIKHSEINYIEDEEVQSIQSLSSTKYNATTNNQEIICDEVILCAGSQPNLIGVRNTSIETRKGILVNEYLQTNHTNVYAAGDVAEHANGQVTGLWHPAEYQGLTAGRNMAGKKEKYIAVPYRLKSEFLDGFLFSANYHQVVDKPIQPHIESKDKVYREFYIIENKLVAVVMMNDKKRAKSYQKAISENWSIDKLQQEIPLA